MFLPPLVFSIWAALVTKVPPLPLAIGNERVIFVDCNPDSGLDMSLSPDGRSLLYGMEEWEPSLSTFEVPGTSIMIPTADNLVWNTFLFDLETGENVKLPFPHQWTAVFVHDFDSGNTYRQPRTEHFTPDGKYVHATDPLEGGASSKVLIYNIGSHALLSVEVGPYYSFVCDDRGENLLVNRNAFQTEVTVVPIFGGAVEKFSAAGPVCGASRKDRAIIFCFSYAFGVVQNQLFLVDLVQAKTLKSLHWRRGMAGMSPIYPEPFYAANERFLCCNECYCPEGLFAAIRNQFSNLVRFIPPSPASKKPVISSACFWDSIEDRVFALDNAIALAPGPSFGTVLIADGEMKNLRVLDLIDGTTYASESHDGDSVACARGKYIVFETKDENGQRKYTLTEIGIPGRMD